MTGHHDPVAFSRTTAFFTEPQTNRPIIKQTVPQAMSVKMHENRTIDFLDEPVRDHNAFEFDIWRTAQNHDKPFTNRTNSQTNCERTDLIPNKGSVSINQGIRAERVLIRAFMQLSFPLWIYCSQTITFLHVSDSTTYSF